MFEAACKDYWKWRCNVGGGSQYVKGKLHGIGCILNPTHILTARHVWSQISSRYSWPVVLKNDGLFRCAVVFESRESDIMVLRTGEKLDDAELEQVNTFPVLSSAPISIGASVGFVSSLHLHRTVDETTQHTYFGGASVSFFIPPEDGAALFYALSGCVVQEGMSGSPVFRPDGSLVGIIVQTTSFRADFHDASAPIYKLPVFSPIRPVLREIQAALQSQ